MSSTNNEKEQSGLKNGKLESSVQVSPTNNKKEEAGQRNDKLEGSEVTKSLPPCPPNRLKPGQTTSVIIPTKYKKEQADGQCKKTFPLWLMPTSLVDKKGKSVRPPSPYPPNRRKPGVTLPIAGRLPYKIMLNGACPDIEKEAVKSLNEVSPRAIATKGKGKGKKGKQK